jgi:Cu(I)/Ag(I) efflux system membrane protein CusA/SilA
VSAPRQGFIARVITWCGLHPGVTIATSLALALASSAAIRATPVDALPDISDRQVIVVGEWMGRSPALVEDQLTWPLSSTLLGTPGVRAVRGQSMPGMSFLYVVLEDDADLERARMRVGETLAQLRTSLPDDARVRVGPDASGVGWVYQYALVDDSGTHSLDALRAFQDFTLRYALQSVRGVAEVASVGGYEREVQVMLRPDALRTQGIDARDVSAAIRAANRDVGAGSITIAGRELFVRGRGALHDAESIGDVVLASRGAGVVVRVRDVAHVATGGRERRGIGDLDGRGETVSGIVVAREGANARDVIRDVEARLESLAGTLPRGVRVVPVYTRATLIDAAIATLRGALVEEMIVVAAIILLFLLHVRSALVPVLVLPLSVAAAFLPMYALGASSNVMSLGGIAIAIGAMVDATIVIVENAHKHLEHAPAGASRRDVLLASAREVGPAIFVSLLIVTVAFLPVFGLSGQAGRLFRPLALTKTFAMLAAALLAVTLAPALLVVFVRGRIRPESEHPVSRRLVALYRPFVDIALRSPRTTLLIGALAVASAVPLLPRIGGEFMPPLDEGDLLYMPTTLPGVAPAEAARALRAQDRALRAFPEVLSVYGKAGRADTATDPAPLEMVETVVRLRPRSAWRSVPIRRWWSRHAPEALTPLLRRLWPDARPRTTAELAAELAEAARLPGYGAALTMPIRTRIDMLSTGVRTEVGVKVSGDDLQTIDATTAAIARALTTVPGTSSAIAERNTGGVFVDVVPRREALARYGLDQGTLLEVVAAAIGGERATTVLDGRARFDVTVRYARDARLDLDALRAVLVPVGAARPSNGMGDGMPPGPTGQLAPIESLPPHDARRLLARPTFAQSMPMGAGGTAAGGATLPPVPGASMNGDSVTGMPDASSMGASGSMGGSAMPGTAMLTLPGTTMNDGAASLPGVSRTASPTSPGGALLQVPLGELADVRLADGPAMIRSEGGRLAGFVYVDVDTEARDLSGYVRDARAQLARTLPRTPGVEVHFTGQYEQVEETNARLAILLPLTILLILALLYAHLRSVVEVLIVGLTVPFALVGSVWALWLLDYRWSAAVGVGVVALIGLAAETGIVMVLYLDRAYETRLREGRIQSLADIVAAHEEGTVARVRPKVMTVATALFGLLPLLWSEGAGADVMKRIAAPMVGGLFSSLFLTLEILPVVYTYWRYAQLRRAQRREAQRAPDDTPAAA